MLAEARVRANQLACSRVLWRGLVDLWLTQFVFWSGNARSAGDEHELAEVLLRVD
jgi:hypothetical protein